MSDYEEEGFHFDPQDHELINSYLIPKLMGFNCGNFIVHKDVYAKEPWLLEHTNDSFFKESEWYYFVTRTQLAKTNLGFGQNSNRKIIGDDGINRGNWKGNKTEDIKDEVTGNIIGVKQTLTFKTSKLKKQKGGDGSCVIVPGSDSSWIMTEYMLPETGLFQALVLCKIHEIKKFKNLDDY